MLAAITGATGHVGNNLIRELLAKYPDLQIRALVMPKENTSAINDLKLERIEGNLLDQNSLLKTFQGADVVFHVAGAISLVPGDEPKIFKVNVEGTQNVIEACRAAGVKRLIVTSSNDALRKPEPGEDVEKIIINPEGGSGSAYGKSKAQASLAVLKAVETGLDAVIVCPTGVIGVHDYLPSLIGKSVLQWARSTIHAYFKGAYDFVDVRDIAKGHILAWEKGKKGEVYLLSQGQMMPIADVIRLVDEAMGRRALLIQIPLILVRLAAFFLLCTPNGPELQRA